MRSRRGSLNRRLRRSSALERQLRAAGRGGRRAAQHSRHAGGPAGAGARVPTNVLNMVVERTTSELPQALLPGMAHV